MTPLILAAVVILSAALLWFMVRRRTSSPAPVTIPDVMKPDALRQLLAKAHAEMQWQARHGRTR